MLSTKLIEYLAGELHRSLNFRMKFARFGTLKFAKQLSTIYVGENRPNLRRALDKLNTFYLFLINIL